MIKNSMLILLLAGLSFFTFALYANSKSNHAIVVRPAHLKAQASFTAQTSRQLKLGDKVSILSRKGGWVLIQSLQDKTRGWLRSYQLRTNIDANSLQLAQKKSSGGGLAALSRSTSALLGTTNSSSDKGVVATIGIRGLSEQELQQAKPNPAELKKMQSYASNKRLATQFARQGRLQVSQ